GRRCRRTGEMRTHSDALATLEVSAGRTHDSLLRGEALAAREETQRTSGGSPFEARIPEYAVQSFGLGVALDLHRPRNANRFDTRGNLASAQDLGGEPQVREPTVRARADEDGVDGDVVQSLS